MLLFDVDSTSPLPSKDSGEDIIFLTNELMLFHADSTSPLPSKGSGEDIIFLTSELSHCSYIQPHMARLLALGTSYYMSHALPTLSHSSHFPHINIIIRKRLGGGGGGDAKGKG